MKLTKRLTQRAAAAVLALTMAAGLSACGDNGGGQAGGQSAEDILKTAQENMAKIESMSYDMVMDIEMSANEQALNINTSGKVDYIVEPSSMKMDMDMDMGEMGKMKTVMYMQKEGDKFIAYNGIDMGDGNLTWQKQEVADSSMIEQMDARETFDVYLSSAQSFKENGSDTVGSAEATRYDGVITEADLSSAMEASGVLDQFASMGVTGDQLDSMLTGLGDLPISIWVSKADMMPVKYEMDMTAIMQSLMGKMMETMGAGEGDTLDVNRVLVSMTVSNINGVDSITIPEEALNATAA